MTDKEFAENIQRQIARIRQEGMLRTMEVETENKRRADERREAQEFVVSTSLGLVPVIGELVLAYEVFSGEDIFGHELSDTQRVISGGLLALPLAAKVVGKVAPILRRTPKGTIVAKELEEATRALKAAATPEEAGLAAARFRKAAKEAKDLLPALKIADSAAGKTGCFEEGTPLLTPTGSKGIEHFRVGDPILSADENDSDCRVAVRCVENVLQHFGLLIRDPGSSGGPDNLHDS